MLWSCAPTQISESVNHFGVGCSCFLVTDVIHLYVASVDNSCSEKYKTKCPNMLSSQCPVIVQSVVANEHSNNRCLPGLS